MEQSEGCITDTSSSSMGSDATQYSEMVTTFATIGGTDTAETDSEAFQWRCLSVKMLVAQ